jgi:hypothetical protein
MSGPTVIPGTDPDEVVKARLEAVMTDVREEILDRLEREAAEQLGRAS